MSVFRVRLSNDGTTSIQKTANITGPNNVTRVLKDGDVFTDSNYFKRFAFPQVPLSEALLVVEVDDGSVYSNNPSENNTLVVETVDTPVSGATVTEIDFVGDHGGPAAWMNIDNTSAAILTVVLNGNASSTFQIQANDSFAFDNGELLISSISITGSGNYTVQVLAGVRVGG